MPLPLLLIILALSGGFIFYEKSTLALPVSNTQVYDHGGYPDIDSTNQGGGYDTTYDSYYEAAAGQANVPFALIKAHAIRESKQDPSATHYDNAVHGGSMGLMQLEFKQGRNYWAKFGSPDDNLGADGSALFDVALNTMLGAKLIRANLDQFGNLRDAINAYNTGKAEADIEAPHNYVDDVLGYYQKILGQKI